MNKRPLKKIVGFSLVSLLLAVFLFNGLTRTPVSASDGQAITGTASLSLSVDKLVVNQDELFTVQVVISSDIPSRGAQFNLSFDPRLASVIEVKEGNYYSGQATANGGSTWFRPGDIDNKTGMVKGAAVAVLGAKNTKITGRGTLAVITMEATSDKVIGTSNLSLSEGITISQDIEEISNTEVNNSKITVSGEGVEVSTLPPVEVTTAVPSDKTSGTSPEILLDVAPSIQTLPASGVSYCGATANGYLNIGDATGVNVYFMWRPNVPNSLNHPEYTTTSELKTQSGYFNAYINGFNTGLGPDIPYEFQAKGEGGGYYPLGQILNYRTQVTMIPDWDVNSDGRINVGDTAKIGLVWGLVGQNGWIRGDVNHDGKINIGDVAKVGLHYGENPVINVQASDGAFADRIRITWLSSYGATGYNLYRNTVNNPPANPIATVFSTTSYDDFSVSIGSTYYYWVKANNSYSESDYSMLDTGWRSVIDAPTSAAASDGTYSDKIRITWTVSSGALGYYIYRNTTNSSSTATQIGTISASPYNDNSAPVDTNYWYWVKAYNSNGDSGFSNFDPGWRALDPPTAVEASDGMHADSVQITWYPVTGASGYKILSSQTDNIQTAQQIGTSTVLNYSDTSASMGIKYYYWIKAYHNLDGLPSDSNSGWRAGDSSYNHVGVYWVSNYDWHPDLPNAGGDATAFANGLSANGYTTVFNKGDEGPVSQADFMIGTDPDNYPDGVDIFWFEGHGPEYIGGIGSPALILKTDVGDLTDVVTYNDVIWGYNELEFVFLHACCELHDDSSPSGTELKTNGKFARALNGAHLICGSYSDMWDSPVDGQNVVDYLTGSNGKEVKSVINSWFEGIKHSGYPTGSILRVIGEDSSYENDYIYGQGTGPAQDVPVDDYYKSWEYYIVQ